MITTTGDLPELREAKNLAERVDSTGIVFRVFDSRSFRKYNPITGFEAIDYDKDSTISQEDLVEAHLTWGNRKIRTPWLSTSRRWLWAAWEMKRRSNYKDYADIQVAVINLEVCRRSAYPPVHALSLLNENSQFRKFSNISDEILVREKIPASAIISVWRLEDLLNDVGIHSVIAQWTPSEDKSDKGYRQAHYKIVTSLDSSLFEHWEAREQGGKCADTAISMLQVGYDHLEEQLEELISPIRETQRWCKAKGSGKEGPVDDLVEQLSAFKLTSEGTECVRSNSAGKNSGSPLPPTLGDALSHLSEGSSIFQKVVLQSGPSAICATEPIDLTGHSDPPILDAYNLLVAHHRSTIDRLSTFTSNNESPLNHTLKQLLRLESSYFHAQRKCYETLIVRLARQKIEYLRSIALELARTIPLAFINGLGVDSHDWLAIRWSIVGCIGIWLAPLERKLERLEEKEVPSQILQARFNWLRKEEGFPQWWESCGMDSADDCPDHKHRPSDRQYA